jgi:lysophospholipase L1-like esterase
MLLATTGIQESLTRASGQPYRKYARPGTRLLDGVIPGQYASAKRADAEIKTVVMTGGGNDIIQNSTLKTDCMQGGAMCDAQVQKIRDALRDLWKQMSTDGVQDVIHVMYSVSAGSGVKNRATHNEKMAEVCAAVPAPLRCHLLDTDNLIGPNDMRSDGIHPTDPGYDKIGKAVFELMQKDGMRR